MKHIAITKQEIDGSEINSVLSTDLHNHLEVKTEHGKWAKRLIEKYEFVENSDYLTVAKKVGRQISTEYIFSIDMAKEVCMVSNTDKGRETRKYFIKVEKQHNSKQMLALNDMMHKTKFLLESNEIIGETISSHDKRITNLEENRRLESWMEKNLLDAKMTRVYQLASNDEKLAKKLHSRIWRAFKNKFHISSYRDLSVGRYEDGLMWLNNVQLHEVV